MFSRAQQQISFWYQMEMLEKPVFLYTKTHTQVLNYNLIVNKIGVAELENPETGTTKKNLKHRII